ncbi:unnamed protein product [Oikopleura dioica]|uniref:BTB domain-containing protein n=1 Tax=Oikopleura dioica TaxID=34765 RepID=E4X8G9_OIKDI|nr:unnamed protein product [Oikopleura dioica]
MQNRVQRRAPATSRYCKGMLLIQLISHKRLAFLRRAKCHLLPFRVLRSARGRPVRQSSLFYFPFFTRKMQAESYQSHAENLLQKLNSQRICGIFVDSSLLSRTGEVVFYHSAILNAISSSTAILPIIADQYSHVTLNLFFEYVYLGVISNDVSIRTYRELWNLGRQLKLKNLQNVLHPLTGVGDVFSPSRKRSKYPTLRKEKEAPEKKKPRLVAKASTRIYNSPHSKSDDSYTAPDRSGARFRIPKSRLKCVKRKLFNLD